MRTELSPDVLTMGSPASVTPDSSTAAVMSSTALASAVCTWAVNSTPPLNSMPMLKPRTTNAMAQSTTMAAETAYQSFRRPTKSNDTRPEYRC